MENTEIQNLKGKNWVATLVLCWFLGMYGAHRFYTGKNNTAWAFVVMSLTGILAPVSMLWSLVDGFAIALDKYTHEDGSSLYERIDWLGYVYIGFMILCVLGAVGYIGVVIAGIVLALTTGMPTPPTP